MSTDSPTDRDDLIPLTWNEALEKHLEMMAANGRAEATIRSHKSRLGRYIDWLTPSPLLKEDEDEGPLIEKTTELQRHHAQDYKLRRAQEVKKITVKTQMDTIRAFYRNLENYGALSKGMHQFVESPSLEGDEGQRSNQIPAERGNTIRDHLRKYRWASEAHVVFELLWSSAIRLGGAHGIDVCDLDLENDRVRLRHRPETGTTLKNQERGERIVSLHPTVSEAIQDFLDRPDRPENAEDEYGRVPLFCNHDGTKRRCKQYLRSLIYSVTRPCKTEQGCPHDGIDPDECPAARSKNEAFRCPSSEASHALRSGAITRMRKEGVPRSIISDRVDASEEVIDRHYDEMTQAEKAEQRRDYFEDEYE